MQELIKKLEQRLQQPLPGLPAQLEMAPPARGQGVLKVPENARHSAVLVLLYPHEDQVYTVFMKRTEDGSVHSGQISFPGGKVEESDRDYVHTALREAEEEVGVPEKKVQVLGHLSQMYIPPSNYLVMPTLGYVPSRPEFVLDPIEVAQVIETPLHVFEAEGVRATRVIEQRTRWGHYRTEAPSFMVDEHLIWGATSMILNELLIIVKDLD